MSHPGSSPRQATTWRGLEHIYIMSVSLQIDIEETRGMEAATSGPPLVLGTVFSMADHPGTHTAEGDGKRGGKAPPPPPPIGPPPGIPTVITCPEGGHRGKGHGLQAPPGFCKYFQMLSPLLLLRLLATPFLMNLRLNILSPCRLCERGGPRSIWSSSCYKSTTGGSGRPPRQK